MRKILIGLFAATVMNVAYADIETDMQERWARIQQLEAKISFNKDKEALKEDHDRYLEEFAIYMEYLREDSERLFAVGDYYFKNKQYDKACEIFSQDDTNIKNIFGAATTARFLNEKEKALKLYNLAIEKEPNFYESYLGRGIIRRDMGKFEEAIEDFKTYMSYTQNEAVYLGLGDIYMKTNRYLEAKNILESGRIKFPNSTLIKEMLLKTYTKLK